MAATVVDSGTFTTSGTTEGTLDTIASTAGDYVMVVDVNAVTAGTTPDIFILRSKQNVLSGGTERLVQELTIVGGLEYELIKYLPLKVTDDATWTVQRAQGSSDRAFPWATLRLDDATAVSSRASQTSVDTVDDFLDTEIAAIKAKTDSLTFTVANQVDANVVGGLTSTERNAVADAILNRDMSTGTDSGSASVRTVRQALRFLRNKWTLTGTTLSVKKEDDSTESWAATVTTDAAAEPITASDPAS